MIHTFQYITNIHVRARDAQINMLHCHEPKKLSINIKTSKVSGHKIRP